MQLSAAFIKGAQFAIGANQLAQDAKAKKDEEIHWRTIGEGEEAHAVPIDGPDPKAKKAETKKAESKKEETKKAESKKAETKKAESKKEETKKAESKKEETKKAETKKEETKKAESKKEETKKAETKKPETKKAEGGAAALASSPTAVLDELRDSVQAQMDRLDDQTRTIDSAKAQKDLSESLNSLSRAAGKKVFKTRQITKESQASGVASLMYDMLDEARDKAQEQGDSRKLAKLALLANMYTSATTIGLNNIEAYVKIRQKAEQSPRDETDKYAKQHNEAIANAKRVIDEQWNSLKSVKQELKNALKSIGLN